MTNVESNPGAYEPTREDVLIGRVVDGEAFASDWEALEKLAGADGGVWERLGRAQRSHARLERDVEDAIALADLVEIPRVAVATQSMNMRIRQYGGWAAAAALALAWAGLSGVLPMGGAGGQASSLGPTGQPMATLSPDAAYEQYVERGTSSGRLVRELPLQLVQARDLGEGRGKEVLYYRMLLERRTVPDVSVLSVQSDEHGDPRLVPMRIEARIRREPPPADPGEVPAPRRPSNAL